MKKKSLVNIIVLVLLGALFLVGCGKENPKEVNDASFKIGINQFTDHPALDQVRLGFEEGLKEFGDFDVDFVSAQGDISNTITISEKFISNGADLIFAIATPSAQSSRQVAGEIPVIFSAVTDPVEAGLVNDFNLPGVNVTGTSDESPVKEQLALFKMLDPSIEKIGIIYNTSEANSKVQIDKATLAAKDLGLKIETIGVSNINDMPQALDSLMKKVDGLYTITDNMVASAISLVADKANEANMITIGAEEAHVAGGVLMTDGLSYFELGRQSARMAKEILIDKKDIKTLSCEKAENTSKVYNENTLKKLNLDITNKAFEKAEKID